MEHLGKNSPQHHLQLTEQDYMDRASDQGREYCWLHVMEGAQDLGRGPIMVLGMPFVRKFTTIFQFLPEPRLGFVAASRVDVGADEKEERGGGAEKIPLMGCRENCG